ncbi:hypothetical protein AVEN_65380-1 [Araneus ventricosus]|uniref:Uncharacterized protein n=1 Tax=Araneus ventricosus TaxID=182803 RepID=A0A4Y2I220_ARAVE|nr:hypothetical protein AVEN_65380-1 [Araneus ventricosus]
MKVCWSSGKVPVKAPNPSSSSCWWRSPSCASTRLTPFWVARASVEYFTPTKGRSLTYSRSDLTCNRPHNGGSALESGFNTSLRPQSRDHLLGHRWPAAEAKLKEGKCLKRKKISIIFLFEWIIQNRF